MSKPNILFIIIDALRADKIYGPKKSPHTPNFDSLIKKGVYFSNTISSADATILSWAGLFTAKHPFKTGIRFSKFKKLNENTTTYFDILKKYNYNFYAFLPISGKVVGIFPEFENNDCYASMPRFGMGLDEKINEFFTSRKKEPWLCYVHSYNLHFPVLSPTDFTDEKFGMNNYEKQISLIDDSIGKLIQSVDLNNTLVVITSDHGSYFPTVINDGKKINFETKGNVQNFTIKVSSKIPKQLHSIKTKLFLSLEQIKKKQRLNKIKNLELKPHELRGLIHQRSNPEKFLYDDLVHVPLLLLGYGLNNKKSISQQVRLIDLFPTICDILKIDNLENTDGESILPLIEGKTLDEKPAYFESSPLVQIKTNDVIGIRTSKYKYFRDRIDPKKRQFLYDLEKDPYENNNIKNNSVLIKEMEGILQQLINDYKFSNDDKTTMTSSNSDTEKIENVLKKLGYI